MVATGAAPRNDHPKNERPRAEHPCGAARPWEGAGAASGRVQAGHLQQQDDDDHDREHQPGGAGEGTHLAPSTRRLRIPYSRGRTRLVLHPKGTGPRAPLFLGFDLINRPGVLSNTDSGATPIRGRRDLDIQGPELPQPSSQCEVDTAL